MISLGRRCVMRILKYLFELFHKFFICQSNISYFVIFPLKKKYAELAVINCDR